jgi:hypothetical protein
MFGYQSHVDLSMNGVHTLSDGFSVLRGGHIAGLSGSFGALTSPQIRGNRTNIEEIKRNLDTNATLDGRVDILETEIAAIQIYQADINALLVEVDKAQADIVLLQQDDVLLRAGAAELQGNVAAIASDLLMTQADVMILQTDTAATRLDVAALESESDVGVGGSDPGIGDSDPRSRHITEPNGWLQFPGTRYRGLSRDEPTGIYLDRDQ